MVPVGIELVDAMQLWRKCKIVHPMVMGMCMVMVQKVACCN